MHYEIYKIQIQIEKKRNNKILFQKVRILRESLYGIWMEYDLTTVSSCGVG